MLHVGFVSYWFARGQAYVTKNVMQAVEGDCEVFVFARSDGRNPIGSGGEWDIPNLTKHDQYQIPARKLHIWIAENDIDLVFFNEEYDFRLVDMVHHMGVATMGIYYWELFNPDYVTACNAVYDAIICPTAACFKRFEELGVENIHHVKWGVDLDVFKPSDREPNDVVRFFHPAGWGGMHNRRGTEFVLEAFSKMESKAELLIHSQHESVSMSQQNAQAADHRHDRIASMLYQSGVNVITDTIPREMLIALYQESDVAILPSKWEGLGLTFLEAIGCGLPIITVDAPPMNEFVDYGDTGFCCEIASQESHSDIFVPGMIPDVAGMAAKMDILARNGDLLNEMRHIITDETRYEWDWKKNSPPLRDLILELGGNAGKLRETVELDNITELIQAECFPNPLKDADTRQYARFHKIMADPMLKGCVLDVGCKHGTLTLMLAEKRCGAGLGEGKIGRQMITGIDQSAENIEICRQAREAKGFCPDDARFHQASIDSLPFADESFDAVILAQVLEHVRDPNDLKELMRVLKPDGCLIITTNVGFAHYDPDHKWFFLPDSTYEMLRGGGFFLEQNGQPAFMKQRGVAPFGAFIEKYLGEAYGYQVYNDHESKYHSLEIYARVYKSEAMLMPFPEIEGDEVVEEMLLSTDEMRAAGVMS